MRKIARLFVVTLVLISGLSSAAFAQSGSASSWNYQFSYGMGTTDDSKTQRYQGIPCHVPVTATVEISVRYAGGLDKTTGYPSTRTIIQLTSPRENLTDPKSVATYDTTIVASGIKKTVTLSGSPSKNGCGNGGSNGGGDWVVKVQPDSGSENLSKYSVSGKITLSYTPSVVTYALADTSEINLGQGNWVERSIAGEHFDYGELEITADIFYPNSTQEPIKLKMELFNTTTNEIAGYSEGYPLSEPRINRASGVTSSPKIRLTGEVSVATFSEMNRNVANYKLRITNIGNGPEALKIRPIIKLTRKCF